MSEELAVKNHLICYIDVLGYQQKINEMGENKFLTQINGFIKSASEIAERSGPFLELLYEKNYDFNIHVFSDNIILFVNVENLANVEIENCLFHMVYTVANLQHLFLYSNLLLRGSIVKGPFYYDPNKYVFGTGLIRAYQLENNSAIYPRVIIENNLVEELMIHSALNEVYIDNLIEDFDGFRFVNYFNYATKGLGRKSNETGGEGILLRGGNNQHNSEIVASQITSNKDNPAILQKYRWLKYHFDASSKSDTYSWARQGNPQQV